MVTHGNNSVVEQRKILEKRNRFQSNYVYSTKFEENVLHRGRFF